MIHGMDYDEGNVKVSRTFVRDLCVNGLISSPFQIKLTDDPGHYFEITR